MKTAVAKREADPDYRDRRDRAASMNGRSAIRIVDRQAGGRTRSEKALGWLPTERRSEYVTLRRELGAAEARRIIQADISTQDQRAADVRARARRDAEQILAGMREREERRRQSVAECAQ